MHPARVVGLLLSALGHAGLIALVVWALPWMRVRPGEPIPVMEVSLLGEEEFAALVRPPPPAPAPPSPTPSPSPAPAPAASPRPAGGPQARPAPAAGEAPAPEAADLAPGFDAASPLGLGGPGGEARGAPEEGSPSRTLRNREDLRAAREGDGEGVEAGAETLEAYRAAVADGIAAARVYPEIARRRGLVGTVPLRVVVARDGRLVNARLLGSSGSETLDRAALAAARDAVLPPFTGEFPGGSMAVDVKIAFAPGDG